MRADNPGFFEIATTREVVTTATRVGLVVGTLLGAINHGPDILSDSMTPLRWLQFCLTYLVPYGVSTYSSTKMIQHRQET